jgi:hypothetical protein
MADVMNRPLTALFVLLGIKSLIKNIRRHGIWLSSALRRNTRPIGNSGKRSFKTG